MYQSLLSSRVVTFNSLVVLLSCFLISPTIWAEASGDNVIRQADLAMTQAKDQVFEFEVNTREPGKGQRTMLMKVAIKGTKLRRVDFLSPGDVKGMKVLVLSLAQMYIYLPAYHKVRRIATHMKEQGFMGTAFGHDEMSIVTYGDVFEGKLLSENNKEWRVRGQRRPGQEFPYPTLDFVFSKEFSQPIQILYYNDKGQKMKTETREEWQCQGKICNPGLIRLVDHTRSNLTSELVRKKWQPNAGLSEQYFSLRDLQRE